MFVKGYTPNWSEEVCHGHMLLMILMEKKFLELFTKQNCKKNKSKRI